MRLIPSIRGSSKAPLQVAFALWVAAFGMAVAAQRLLTSPDGIVSGAALYGVAAVVAVAAVAGVERSRSLPPSPEPRPGTPPEAALKWGSAPGLVALGFLLLGVAFVLISLYLMASWQAYSDAFSLWAVGLGLLLIGADRWDGAGRPPGRASRSSIASVEGTLVLGILIIAVALRWTDLVQFPPNVHGDEGAVGEEARRVLHGQVPNLFSVGWYGIPYLSFALRAPSMALFGDNLYGLRMGSVIQGTLSVLLLFLLARRLFSVRVAGMAAFLMVVSQWHIHFSRLGIDYIQALVAELLLFYFLVRGLQTRRRTDFLLAGFSVGLCLNMYFAARIAPAIAGLYLLCHLWWRRGFLREQWQQLTLLLLGALLFLAPMGLFYLRDPSGFVGRPQGVFLLTPENLAHSYQAYRVNSLQEVLRNQIINTALAFNQRGETSLQYGHRAPLLDGWSGPLFVLGLAAVTVRLRRAPYFFLASWFWLTLLVGSILTVDAMASPRLVVIIPALFILAALFLNWGWQTAALLFGRQGWYGAAALVAILTALSALSNYSDYFRRYAIQEMPAGFNTVMSCYVGAINSQYRVYLMGKSDTTLRYETPRFLIPNADGVDVGDRPLPLPVRDLPETKGIAFVLDMGAADATQRLAGLRGVYPGGQQQLHSDINGRPLFYSYLVGRDELATAASGAAREGSRPTQLPEVRGIPPGQASAILGGGQPSAQLSGFPLGLLAALLLALSRIAAPWRGSYWVVFGWTGTLVGVLGYLTRGIVTEGWSIPATALGAGCGAVIAKLLERYYGRKEPHTLGR